MILLVKREGVGVYFRERPWGPLMLHEAPEGSSFFSDLVSVWVGFWASLSKMGLFLACLALFDHGYSPRDKRGKPGSRNRRLGFEIRA